MAEIVRLIEHRKRIRADLTAEILNHDRHPAPDDVETDRLIRTLNTLMTETPMAGEEKVVAVWTTLVELLAAIEDEKERNLYTRKIAALLNQDIVEAARAAFAKF